MSVVYATTVHRGQRFRLDKFLELQLFFEYIGRCHYTGRMLRKFGWKVRVLYRSLISSVDSKYDKIRGQGYQQLLDKVVMISVCKLKLLIL